MLMKSGIPSYRIVVTFLAVSFLIHNIKAPAFVALVTTDNLVSQVQTNTQPESGTCGFAKSQ